MAFAIYGAFKKGVPESSIVSKGAHVTGSDGLLHVQCHLDSLYVCSLCFNMTFIFFMVASGGELLYFESSPWLLCGFFQKTQ